MKSTIATVLIREIVQALTEAGPDKLLAAPFSEADGGGMYIVHASGEMAYTGTYHDFVSDMPEPYANGGACRGTLEDIGNRHLALIHSALNHRPSRNMADGICTLDQLESGAKGTHGATQALAMARALVDEGKRAAATAAAQVAAPAPAAEPQGDVTILGACTIIDGAGRPHRIKRAYVRREGHIPDLYVEFDLELIAKERGHNLRGASELRDIREEHEDLRLWDDDTFIDNVMKRLHDAGYVGRNFGRAELGMQGYENAVVLEPPKEFNAFAAAKGWRYLGDAEEDAQSDALQRIPCDWYVTFSTDDGSVYGVPVREVALHRAQKMASEGISGIKLVSEQLATNTVPYFLSDKSAAADYAGKLMSFEHIRDHLQRLAAPREPDLGAAWASSLKRTKTVAEAAAEARGAHETNARRAATGPAA